MIKPKYKRTTEQDAILQNETFKANGCHCWFLYNAGNTNATIGTSHVLKPGEGFGFDNENPDIVDYSELPVLFDAANDPITVAPGAGAIPGPFVYTFGVDPVPDKNNKIVVYRSILSEL